MKTLQMIATFILGILIITNASAYAAPEVMHLKAKKDVIAEASFDSDLSRIRLESIEDPEVRKAIQILVNNMKKGRK